MWRRKLALCGKIVPDLPDMGTACGSSMHLSDHDLLQLDDAYLEGLSPVQARALLAKALADLKAARERLAQNPSNSSRPPSSRAPWERVEDGHAGDGVDGDGGSASGGAAAQQGEQPQRAAASRGRKGNRKGSGKPGRPPGAPGHSRTQVLPIDAEQMHAPGCCAACARALEDGDEARAHAAHYTLDLSRPDGGAGGLVLHQTKHVYLERRCTCGHWTRAQPARCDKDDTWTVALSEWHLAGPSLVAFICALTQRMRLSRARVQELLADWLGLSLSTATINQCIHEAARAVEPVLEQEILAHVRQVELLYADETAWKEHGRLLWLWVFTCATATLFIVGRRTREMVQRVLGEHFRNWLMSDGYCVYRDIDQRLRCLAHLIRKAQGLEDSLDPRARAFGRHVLDVIETVIAAVYDARGAPQHAAGLRTRHAPTLNALFEACRRLADDARHEKARALARELLNDWDTFWVVLDHPELPLTNNEAERALRHWVIARRIGMGTRTPQGTRAFALLASVIETCRKRGASPWTYIADVVRQRRRDLPALPLPLPAG